MAGAWSEIDLGGHRANIYDPPRAPSFGLLFLHDEDGRTPPGLEEVAQECATRGLACVAPQGGDCWWADRICPTFDSGMTPERYLLELVVPFFATRWNLDTRALGLLGQGMGGQGALRLAFKHPKTFAVVAGWDSALDHQERYHEGTSLDDMYDSMEQCRQDTAILHVHPADYPPHLWFACTPDSRWHRGNDRLHEKLRALGIGHEAVLSTEGSLVQAIDFVHKGLVTQGRRLL